jgi:hypothetical protein
MYELKTEREQLMQKVDAQSNYIEKADATAKTQAKQLLDQNKRIKQSEEEIQHVKTTQMIDMGICPFKTQGSMRKLQVV